MPKWRKICKTLLTLDVNETAKLRVRHWFPAAILAADEDLTRAIKDEEREPINNKQFARRVSEARRKYQALVKRYDAYKTIIDLED